MSSPSQAPKPLIPPPPPPATPPDATRIPPPPKPVIATQNLTQTILAGFNGQIEKTPFSASYIVGLALAAFVMVLLPLVYLGMVGFIGYIFYSILQPAGELVDKTVESGKSAALAKLAYYGPMIVGLAILAFMLKPVVYFFFGGGESGRKVTKNSEPLLFAFVEKLAQSIGAPMPTEIRVDCDSNASASFQGGLFGFFTNELTLTIGMPLAGGLTLRQFAGVVAHELGHFSQPVAMRLTYVIHSVNRWFVCAIYGGSGRPLIGMDSELVRNNILTLAIYLLSAFFVWLTKGVMYILFTLGHWASSYLLRQMEFNADTFEARVAGSEGFDSTMKKLRVINVATMMAHDSLSYDWQEGRLPNDLPGLIVHKTRNVTPEIENELKKHQLREETQWYDSHPADHDRAVAVAALRCKGIFHLAMPAAMLFRDFAALSRSTTTDFYKEQLEDNFKADAIRPLADLIQKERSDEEGEKILEAYFQADIPPYRGLGVSETLIKPAADPGATIAGARADREQALRQSAAYRDALKEIAEGETKLLKAQAAAELLGFGCAINPKEFDLPAGDIAAARSAINEWQQRLSRAYAVSTGYEELCARRLVNAMTLLASPQISGSLAGSDKLQETAQDLLPLMKFFAELLPVLSELQDKYALMIELLNNLQGREENSGYVGRAERAIKEALEQIRRVDAILGNTVYPFDHARGIVTLKEMVLKHVPTEDAPRRIAQVCEEIINGLYPVHRRILMRLSVIAQDVDRAVGLEPLIAPSAKKGELSRLREQGGPAPRPSAPGASPTEGEKKARGNTSIRF